MEKKRMKKITWRWLVNSFGVVLLIVVVMVIAIAVSVHSYYYNGARQFLLSRSDSVATLLENYSKDSSADFSQPFFPPAAPGGGGLRVQGPLRADGH